MLLLFCDLVLCPKGDDPKTGSQVNRKIKISIDGSAAVGGSVRFTFVGHSVELAAGPSALTGATCAAAISSLPNVESATCTVAYAPSTYHSVFSLRRDAHISHPFDNTYITYIF